MDNATHTMKHMWLYLCEKQKDEAKYSHQINNTWEASKCKHPKYA